MREKEVGKKETYRILAVNPGSTSTKIAVFDGEDALFRTVIEHDAEHLRAFRTVSEQFFYRKGMILAELERRAVPLESCDAFVGRGGGLESCEGGVYEVSELMKAHAASGEHGGDHPAALGCRIAGELASACKKRAFVVNPPDTDEFCDVARVTGLSGVYRASHIHALNQKEIAIQAARRMSVDYEKVNLIIAHIGGGTSVTAHRQGKMIDSNDVIYGEGPMAPTRMGGVPLKPVLDRLRSGTISEQELYDKITKSGGFVDHLGTSDMLEIKRRIGEGDRYAKLIYDAFIYQIAKEIGAMAVALEGRVRAIILTGGIARDEELTGRLKRMTGFIAPVYVRSGEMEMEAMAAGAIRVLTGKEEAKVYTGRPVFTDFNEYKIS